MKADDIGSRPKIVCLSGSARFMDVWMDAYIKESMKGRIVLTIAGDCKVRSDYEQVKPVLDLMYRHKIEMADELLVLNVGGYIGESTKNEIAYARSLGKKVRWLEHNIPIWKRVLNKVRGKLPDVNSSSQ